MSSSNFICMVLKVANVVKCNLQNPLLHGMCEQWENGHIFFIITEFAEQCHKISAPHTTKEE